MTSSVAQVPVATPASAVWRVVAAARVVGLLPLLVVASAGCGAGMQRPVRVDDAPLGRIVIYRNGVAYYERRADVVDGKLVISVPSDKIDDFLKSMTITDVATGQPLPVSFPAPGTRPTRPNGTTELVVQVPLPAGPKGSARAVSLTYVTEAAAWKPSYRVVLQQGSDGKTTGVELQGWAVVDNTSSEDWTRVRVGVGSSSALAFRYDLRSIRTVQRQTLHGESTFVRAPPGGGAVGQERPADSERELAQVDDADLARPKGHPDVAEREQPAAEPAMAEASVAGRTANRKKRAAAEESGYATGSGRQASPGPSAAARPPAPQRQYRVAPSKDEAHKAGGAPQRDARDAQLDALADRLRRTGEAVRIEGFADAGEPDSADRARDRAHVLRNQLIERGVAPAQVVAVGRGVLAGQRAGVRVVALPASQAASAAGTGAGSDAPPVGESHFESVAAMTVARGSSAMVSIVKAPTQGDIVYLYQPEGRGGDENFAFRAVRFRNPTRSTLDAGPMTVYGSGRFIGEGLSDPIPPGQHAIVPYALDRQVRVEREDGHGERIARLIKVNRGVLTAEIQRLRLTTYRVANRGHEQVTVLLRHETPKGWEFQGDADQGERLGAARLLKVELAPGTSKVVKVEESTPLERTVDLRTSVGVEMVRLHLSGAKADERLRTAMAKALEHHDEMVKAEQRIDALRERNAELRVRLDELHAQLASLQGMARGAALEAHLGKKMRETSEAVQQATVAIVQAQQDRMLARVRFQDALTEVSLAPTKAGS